MAFVPTFSAFPIVGQTPSTTPPSLFFPLLTAVGSVFELSNQTTARITPAASEVVFVVIGIQWWLYTLTAGTASNDATHVLPADYDPATNAKHWFLTDSGYIGRVLIDQNGDVLTDGNGNTLSY